MLPDHEAETVTETSVNNFGVPQEVYSDLGWVFDSVMFQELSIIGYQEDPYHYLDGLVEKFNRTLIHEVAKYCSSDQTSKTGTSVYPHC